jgi:glycosyltransferase involved in cell wall biosynthesis
MEERLRHDHPEMTTEPPLRVAQWVRIRWWNACAWYAVTLAQALSRLGHVSFVLAPSDTPAALEARTAGVVVPEVGDLGRTVPHEWLRSDRLTRLFLIRERIQLINVHSGPGHAHLAILGRSLGIPVVRTRGDIRPPRATPLQRWLYHRGTAHHLAAAEFIRREYYEDLCVLPDRITTLRGGIDLRRLEQISVGDARRVVRGRLGLPEDSVLVGMVGRLSPVKGHAHFLEAIALCSARFPQVHLVIAGPDAQLTRDDLRARARALNLEKRTHLVGRVDDPLVWCAALDVAVIASIDSEAICRSALEFLGLGIPLVATTVHAIPEVVPAGVGLRVPPADPAAMAGAIESLLASPWDRASLSLAGRDHVRQNYSLECFGRAASTLFRRIIREHLRDG